MIKKFIQLIAIVVIISFLFTSINARELSPVIIDNYYNYPPDRDYEWNKNVDENDYYESDYDQYEVYEIDGLYFKYPYPWDVLKESEVKFTTSKDGELIAVVGDADYEQFIVRNYTSKYKDSYLNSESWANLFKNLQEDEGIFQNKNTTIEETGTMKINRKNVHYIGGNTTVNNMEFYYKMYFFVDDNKYYTLTYLSPTKDFYYEDFYYDNSFN